jgi:hypothetical protein
MNKMKKALNMQDLLVSLSFMTMVTNEFLSLDHPQMQMILKDIVAKPKLNWNPQGAILIIIYLLVWTNSI